jgi:hypothetical protein
MRTSVLPDRMVEIQPFRNREEKSNWIEILGRGQVRALRRNVPQDRHEHPRAPDSLGHVYEGPSTSKDDERAERCYTPILPAVNAHFGAML